jgi:hypothetical protein
MSAQAITYAVLSGSPAVAAIAGARIYPLVLPEGIRPPAVVYELLSSNEHRTVSMAHTQRMVQARVRVTGVVSPGDYGALTTVMDAIRSAAVGKVKVILAGIANVVLTAGPESQDNFDAEALLASRSRVFNITFNEDNAS